MSRKAQWVNIKVGDDQRTGNDRIGESGSVESGRKVRGAIGGIDAKQGVGSSCIANKDDIDHMLLAIGPFLHEEQRIRRSGMRPSDEFQGIEIKTVDAETGRGELFQAAFGRILFAGRAADQGQCAQQVK